MNDSLLIVHHVAKVWQYNIKKYMVKAYSLKIFWRVEAQENKFLNEFFKDNAIKRWQQTSYLLLRIQQA